MERGIAGESIDREFTARMVLRSTEERDAAVNMAVRSSDEKVGKIREFISDEVEVLFGVVHGGDVDGDGSVPGLECQEFGRSEVSNYYRS